MTMTMMDQPSSNKVQQQMSTRIHPTRHAWHHKLTRLLGQSEKVQAEIPQEIETSDLLLVWLDTTTDHIMAEFSRMIGLRGNALTMLITILLLIAVPLLFLNLGRSVKEKERTFIDEETKISTSPRPIEAKTIVNEGTENGSSSRFTPIQSSVQVTRKQRDSGTSKQSDGGTTLSDSARDNIPVQFAPEGQRDSHEFKQCDTMTTDGREEISKPGISMETLFKLKSACNTASTTSRQDSVKIEDDDEEGEVDAELHDLLAEIDNLVGQTSDDIQKRETPAPSTVVGTNNIETNTSVTAEESASVGINVESISSTPANTRPSVPTTTPESTKKAALRVRERYKLHVEQKANQLTQNDTAKTVTAVWSQFVGTVSSAAATTTKSWRGDNNRTSTIEKGKTVADKKVDVSDAAALRSQDSYDPGSFKQLWSKVRTAAPGEVPVNPRISKNEGPTRQLTDVERARLFAASVLEESDDYEKKTKGANSGNMWFGSAWSSK